MSEAASPFADLLRALADDDDPTFQEYLNAPAWCITCGVRIGPDELCDRNLRPWGLRHTTCAPTDVAAPERGGKEDQ